jgi:hypothetical protein
VKELLDTYETAIPLWILFQGLLLDGKFVVSPKIVGVDPGQILSTSLIECQIEGGSDTFVVALKDLGFGQKPPDQIGTAVGGAVVHYNELPLAFLGA